MPGITKPAPRTPVAYAPTKRALADVLISAVANGRRRIDVEHDLITLLSNTRRDVDGNIINGTSPLATCVDTLYNAGLCV